MFLFQDAQLFNWSKKCVDYRNTTTLKHFYNSIAKLVSNTVKDWPGFEAIAKKLQSIPQHVHDAMYDVYQAHENTFNVITHGDMFLNNILFRNNQNGDAVDIRFVSILLLIPFNAHTAYFNFKLGRFSTWQAYKSSD